MKIAYIHYSLIPFGGIERVLTTKANYLANKGFDVYFITFNDRDEKSYYKLDDRIKRIDLNTPVYSERGLNRIRSMFLLYKRIKDVLLKNGFDFLFFPVNIKETSFLYRIKDGSKKIGEFHDTRAVYEINSNSFGQYLKEKFRYWLNTNTIRNIDEFVVLTERDAKLWKEKNNINSKVIPNPLPFSISDKSELNNKTAITLGRFTYQKGFDQLIEAWRIVMARYPEWILNIYGQGEDYDMLDGLIRKNNLENHVFLKPPVSNVIPLLLNSSIYIMSSRYEGFPMVLLESIACGLPCISYDINCGPSDIIISNRNGYLVESGNINLLARSIIYLIENPHKMLEMGKYSKEYSLQFQIDNVMDKWISLLKEYR